VAGVVVALALQLARGVRGHGALRPHLPVRVRVAGAHHLAAVLEQLHVADLGARAQLGRLLRPQVDHAAHRGLAQRREGQVVPRREADHAAGARFGFGREQPLAVEHDGRVAGGGLVGRVGLEGGEVVGEDEGARVVGVALAVGAHVPGAQVAGGVVRGPLGGGGRLDLPCHGRCVRCGETSTHSPASGLKRRCGRAASACSPVLEAGEVMGRRVWAARTRRRAFGPVRRFGWLAGARGVCQASHPSVAAAALHSSPVTYRTLDGCSHVS
jgi:hypothetical protein